MKKSILFVSGIHGVGKTTLCDMISDTMGINSYSSSDLIRKFKSMPSNEKNVENISENQDILLQSIRLNVKEEKEYILDGHFILLDTGYNFVEVPLRTFADMDIKHIIILYNNVETILKRLNERDKSNYTKGFIEEFQNKEIDRGIEVAKKLDYPYSIIDSDDTDNLLEQIKNIIGF